MAEAHRTHFPSKITELPPYQGAFDAYRLAAEGADVLFAGYPAGSAIPSHDHDSENHGVVTMGELILETDGAERRYKPGEWYFLEPHQAHSARFEAETAIIEFWFAAG